MKAKERIEEKVEASRSLLAILDCAFSGLAFAKQVVFVCRPRLVRT